MYSDKYFLIFWFRYKQKVNQTEFRLIPFVLAKILDKNPKCWSCYVLENIKATPEDKLYTFLPEFWGR